MEIIKLLVCMREQIDITEPFVFSEVKKSLLSGSAIVFIQPAENASTERAYPLKTVRESIAKLSPKLMRLPADHGWPYVNREYALKRLSEAGLMKLIQ
jgi:hypothetical protein